MDDLTNSMNSHHVDIACITETWLTPLVPDSAINISGFTIVRKDRTCTLGGGVCLYIRESINYKIWHDQCEDGIESLWVTLRPKRMPRSVPQITIGAIYMPPGCTARPRQEKEYLSHILKCMDVITQQHPATGIIITGDFNHMKDTLLKRYPLRQIVKSPTHGKSILDCVYTNLHQYYPTPSTHPGLGLCHHLLVCCTPHDVLPNKASSTILRRSNKHSDKAMLVSKLCDVNWNPLYRLPTCTEQLQYFLEKITALLSTYLPLKTITIYETDKPWVTPDYKCMITSRQKALNSGDTTQFKSYRNKVNRASKSLRAAYYRKNINGLQQSNPRMWWKKTQTLIGRNTKSNNMIGM